MLSYPLRNKQKYVISAQSISRRSNIDRAFINAHVRKYKHAWISNHIMRVCHPLQQTNISHKQ